ncbi:hypothetical protein A6J64_013880 [Yersinia enterocolitica]|nr:hypothetical protein A6J64_013880 [Yersinia enterocolitica]
MRWLLSLLGPSMGLASVRPLQATSKSAPGRFVTRITYLCKLIGILLFAAFLHHEIHWVYDLIDLLC